MGNEEPNSPDAEGDAGSELPSREATIMGDAPVRGMDRAPNVDAVDAERIRSALAAKMFGAAADPVKIGRFTVLRRLGAGGMGVVYGAYDDQLDRKVAIKLLRGNPGERQKARLMREAQALAKLSHPNVIQVYEVGDFRGQVFVAMEFVKGATLGDWVEERARSQYEILDKYLQAGRGLEAAHGAGLVHRDFKPENTLVGEDGRVRVLDFGLARAAGRDAEDSIEEPEPDEDLRSAGITTSGSDSLEAPLTKTGAIMGTPAYMSPEQHLGQPTDARTDQFSFCVALWEALYGERPFEGKTAAQLGYAVTQGRIREVKRPPRPVPAWLRRALTRGLQSRPEDRYASMGALLAALDRDRRRRKRNVGLGVGAVVVAIAGFVGVQMQQRAALCEGTEERLVGVWDDEVRKSVREAFLATEVPAAEDAWNSTVRLIDTYAADWSTMNGEACEAALVRKEESPELYGRRMVCLGQRLAELQELSLQLREADADVVNRAVVASGSLARLEPCADERALMAVDVPIDESKREDFDRLDRLVAQAKGRLHLGKYDEGAEIAAEAVELAKTLEHPASEARALLVLGRVQSKLRQLDEAKANLHESQRRADAARDDLGRVRAWIALLRVAVLEQDFDTGEALAADTRAALGRVGEAPLMEADLNVHLGSLALAGGDAKAAIEHHKHALEIRERTLGETHTDVAIALNNLGNAMTGAGLHAEAEEVHRRALSLFEMNLGADHPYVAASRNGVGNTLLEQGRMLRREDAAAAMEKYKAAVPFYQRAIEIREANFGSDHVTVSLAVHNLGESLRRQGKARDAVAKFERALSIKEKHYGAEHGSIALTLTGLGRARLDSGEVAGAVAPLQRALKIRQARAKDTAPEDLAEVLFATATALELSGQRVEGLNPGEMATEAAKLFADAGESYRGELEEVQAWLEVRPEAGELGEPVEPAG